MPVIALHVAGQVFTDWTSAEITRSLTDVSGSFRLDYDDQVRMQGVRPRNRAAGALTRIDPGLEARIEIDGELVLLGWIEDVAFEVSGDQVQASLAGRDRTGDLVDCSANPHGPVEYRGLTLLDLATKLCAPFGIPVRADVDVGAPFAEFALDVGEPLLSALDKASKQRAVMIVSDGVGGLLLTRSGRRRAPAPLRLPGNAVSVGARLSSRERFSDYYVKGQTRQGRGRGGAQGKPALDSTAMPLTARPVPGTATAAQAQRPVSAVPLDSTAHPLSVELPEVTVTAKRVQVGRRVEQAVAPAAGHARDPVVTRYRPRVWLARTQSGGAPLQMLADWRMRLARGHADQQMWTVAGFRDGRDDRLWRPNEAVSVEVGGEDGSDMLVQGVVYSQDDQGSRSVLTVVGSEAYDQEPLPGPARRHAGSRASPGRSRPTPRGRPA